MVYVTLMESFRIISTQHVTQKRRVCDTAQLMRKRVYFSISSKHLSACVGGFAEDAINVPNFYGPADS
jgi:hypothetical protein